MRDMSSYYEKEALCEAKFRELGECYHLWTPENHEIIFTSQADFETGMTLFGISAKLFADVTILTFELMSNHIHISASGKVERIIQLFDTFRGLSLKWLKKEGRVMSLDRFFASKRRLMTLEDIRNVIVYDNRNGFIVNPEHTPFTYPWGANRYYFSPDSCRLAGQGSKPFSLRERRLVSHSRIADEIEGLLLFDGYASPLSFCDIHAGEALFRDATHYFNRLSRSVESNALIAKEIGESVWYTDDELYSIVRKISREKYGASSLALIAPNDRIELAKVLHYEYNASSKQLQRMLKLDSSVFMALGIN